MPEAPVSEISLGDVIQQPMPPETLEASGMVCAETVILPPQTVNDDIISISIRDDELPDAVLKAVLQGLAEEANALVGLRVDKAKEKKDFSHISLKRGTLLKYMSETLIQRQALVGGSGEIDLKGPKFREVFKMFLRSIADTFDEVRVPSEYKDLFFQALTRNMEGWEMRAEKILKTIH